MTDLPNIDKAIFLKPTLDAIQDNTLLNHPPKILLLMGHLGRNPLVAYWQRRQKEY